MLLTRRLLLGAFALIFAAPTASAEPKAIIRSGGWIIRAGDI
jgi:hypothetical protein